jgi:hypothetical protein
MKMASDYTREFSPQVNAAIAACNSIEEIREVMKHALASEGVARLERDSTFTNVESAYAQQAQFAPASQPDAPTSNLLRRVITVNGKDWLISGHSDEELYKLEMGMKAAL